MARERILRLNTNFGNSNQSNVLFTNEEDIATLNKLFSMTVGEVLFNYKYILFKQVNNTNIYEFSTIFNVKPADAFGWDYISTEELLKKELGELWVKSGWLSNIVIKKSGNDYYWTMAKIPNF